MREEAKPWMVPVIRQSAQLFGETVDSSMSVEVQLERITRWAMASGEYAGVRPPIVEYAVSGAAPLRKGFDEMRRQAAPDVHFGLYKFDRLARDLLAQETIVRAVRLEGSAVVSISEPNSDLVRGIFGAVNEDFRRQLSERIRDMYRGRALRGVQGGKGPYGYARSGVQRVVRSDGTAHERPHGDFVPREDQAAVVGEVFARYDAGEGRAAIQRDLNARGVPTMHGAAGWTIAGVSKVLRQPMYAGFVSLHGRRLATGTGGWVRNPAYEVVDPAQWERVQARLAGSARTRGNKRGASWLDGLVEHGCGRRMYATWFADRASTRFVCRTHDAAALAPCGVGQRTVSARKLEAAVHACLVHDLWGLRSIGEAVELAEASSGGELARDRGAEIARELARQLGRVERARALFIEEGSDAARVAYERVRDGAVIERVRLEAEAAMLPVPPDPARYAEMGAHLGSVAAVISRMSDAGCRSVLEGAGVAVFAGGSVSIRYAGEAAGFVVSPTVRRV